LTQSVVAPVADEQERRAEVSLRPNTLHDFVGQRELVRHLEIVLGSARSRGQSVDHSALCRPSGTGQDLARRHRGCRDGFGTAHHVGTGALTPGDLAALLTDLQDGDVLFIDEIHRLSRAVEEILYPAMEDRSGRRDDRARSFGAGHPLWTCPTSRWWGRRREPGWWPRHLRDRFGFIGQLDLYDTQRTDDHRRTFGHVA
jgi:Holliday junction DNA helicase RuvB